MLFNIYERYDLEVTRVDESWIAHRVEGGKRRRVELAIPPDLPEEESASIWTTYCTPSGPPGRARSAEDWLARKHENRPTIATTQSTAPLAVSTASRYCSCLIGPARKSTGSCMGAAPERSTPTTKKSAP